MDLVRLGAMARKEWIQLTRDARSMALAFALPLFLLVFFGYAITWDVDDLELVVVDGDRTAESRGLVDAFVSSGYFQVVAQLDDPREAADWLERGRARAVLDIPAGFTADRERAGGATLQLLVDGSDANTATIAQNYADAIVAQRAMAAPSAAANVSPGGAGAPGGASGPAASPSSPPVDLATRTWYNPNLESRTMIVPGLIAVIMSIIAAMLTALTVAREWERGTMEQLASTPVGRLEVILGKLLPYVAIGMFDVTITVVAGMLLFGTPLNGSVLLLAAMSLLFLVGALALGIFISAAVKSQVLATQIAMVATYLPAVLLSGFLFDIASMPPVLRVITHLIPARYFITVTRGIFLKGVGLGVLWPQGLFMLIYALVGLALATRAFRKELEP